MNEREKNAYYLPDGVPLPDAAGVLRPANGDDNPLLTEWIHAFYIETLAVKPPDLTEFKHNNLTAVTKRTAALYIWQNATDAPIAAMGMVSVIDGETEKLNLIFVPKENRRKGYGKAIVAALCGIIRSRGKKPVLNAYADNAAAIRLYEGLGFTLTSCARG
ncbi:MAG: GNAT family N-acetyltransferase [Defluviitaleaceae bacterium]|nr:GNAT family N-acetyltransferase [Defluviitaleaceae bacterium]